MMRRIVPVLGVAALALAMACSKSSAPLTPTTPTVTVVTPADGSTLKVSAPGVVSPTGNAKMSTTVVVLTAAAATPQFATDATFQYRFQVFNAANVMIDQALVSSLTWQVTAELPGSVVHTWRVRAENASGVGPWSTNGSFISADPFLINDPLTNGTTVGSKVGGHFTSKGWESDSLVDEIEYDMSRFNGGKACSNCTLEFDVTNFGKQEGLPFGADVKWINMGDATVWNDFQAYRDHPWKMHIEERADSPNGIKLIWRAGKTNDENDHTMKTEDGPNFSGGQVFHFKITWDGGGFIFSINGQVIFQSAWANGPRSYNPPNHRISLGCYPRGETMVNAIWSNVTLVQEN